MQEIKPEFAEAPPELEEKEITKEAIQEEDCNGCPDNEPKPKHHDPQCPFDHRDVNIDRVRKNDLAWRRATLFIKLFSVIPNVLLIIAVEMALASIYADLNWVDLNWIESAEGGVFGKTGHFFHVFLYSLVVLITISLTTRFVSRLMSQVCRNRILQLWEVYLYAAVVLSVNVTSFIIFMHTVTEVAPPR